MTRRRIPALILALICLLLCGCGVSGRGDQEPVTLWCLEDDPLRGALEELVERYDRDRGGLLPVELRSFPDEESLAEAFHASRPDLLLCSHDRALALERQGILRDVRAGLGEGAPSYPASLEGSFDAVGRSYFPLGAQVTLLAVTAEAAETVSPEQLQLLDGLCACAEDYAARTGRPFFTADSFSELFYLGMLSQLSQFHADETRDRHSSAYLRVYTQLTDCAFRGGLAVSEHAGADLLRSGAIACAALPSTALPGAGFEPGLLLPLPGLEMERELPALCTGIAVTAREGRGLRSAAGFLSWLFAEGRAEQAALDAGLVPASLGEMPEQEGLLPRTLLALRGERTLHLYDPEGEYWRSRDGFEEQLRAILRRLR